MYNHQAGTQLPDTTGYNTCPVKTYLKEIFNLGIIILERLIQN